MHDAQAPDAGGPYGAAMPHPLDAMLPWLAEAASAARNRRGRKLVHVAASASVDQSTMSRFEDGTAWPKNPDRIIGAYADDLDVDPVAIWADALARWEAAKRLGEELGREDPPPSEHREDTDEATGSSDAGAPPS